jgi:hypothetical protein
MQLVKHGLVDGQLGQGGVGHTGVQLAWKGVSGCLQLSQQLGGDGDVVTPGVGWGREGE